MEGDSEKHQGGEISLFQPLFPAVECQKTTSLPEKIIYNRTCEHVCVLACVYVCERARMYVNNVHVCVSGHVSMCVSIHTCVPPCVWHVCVWGGGGGGGGALVV